MLGIGKYKDLLKIIKAYNLNFIYLIQDNDNPGFKTSLKILKDFENIKVFEWYTFLSDYNLLSKNIKDINDVIIHIKKRKLTFIQLSKYFTNNILRKDLLKTFDN